MLIEGLRVIVDCWISSIDRLTSFVYCGVNFLERAQGAYLRLVSLLIHICIRWCFTVVLDIAIMILQLHFTIIFQQSYLKLMILSRYRNGRFSIFARYIYVYVSQKKNKNKKKKNIYIYMMVGYSALPSLTHHFLMFFWHQ